jgi:hypothetical protein
MLASVLQRIDAVLDGPPAAEHESDVEVVEEPQLT